MVNIETVVTTFGSGKGHRGEHDNRDWPRDGRSERVQGAS